MNSFLRIFLMCCMVIAGCGTGATVLTEGGTIRPGLYMGVTNGKITTFNGQGSIVKDVSGVSMSLRVNSDGTLEVDGVADYEGAVSYSNTGGLQLAQKTTEIIKGSDMIVIKYSLSGYLMVNGTACPLSGNATSTYQLNATGGLTFSGVMYIGATNGDLTANQNHEMSGTLSRQ